MMEYTPIDSVNPDQDVLRCLSPDTEQRQRLLEYQGAFGIGAYDNGVFVGSLWFYRVENLELGNPFAPTWSGWCHSAEDYARFAPQKLPVAAPLLGLSCFHVGRTKQLEAVDKNDESYYGKGIGSGLLAAAVKWAAGRDYRWIMATSGIDAFPEFNCWAGLLPLKAFLRNGFVALRPLNATQTIPGHLQDLASHHSPQELVHAVVGKRMHSMDSGE